MRSGGAGAARRRESGPRGRPRGPRPRPARPHRPGPARDGPTFTNGGPNSRPCLPPALAGAFPGPMASSVLQSSESFHAAARRGDFVELRRLLTLDATLVSSRDGNGRSLLHHLAVLLPSEPAVEALGWLQTVEGLQVDSINEKTGLTPLMRAVMSDNIVCASCPATVPEPCSPPSPSRSGAGGAGRQPAAFNN